MFFTFKKYRFCSLLGRLTVTLAVLVHADMPQLSADMTLVPSGMAEDLALALNEPTFLPYTNTHPLVWPDGLGNCLLLLRPILVPTCSRRDENTGKHKRIYKVIEQGD